MDSNNGYSYEQTPDFYQYGQGGFTFHTELPYIVRKHIFDLLQSFKPSPDKLGEIGAYDFYWERFFAIPNYGEKSGMQIIALICRCAFNDEVLTDSESISIINICHSPEWYKIFKEMNFNEGWN